MNTLQNHPAARNPGGNVIPLRRELSQSTPFDRLTATLVVAQFRQGILARGRAGRPPGGRRAAAVSPLFRELCGRAMHGAPPDLAAASTGVRPADQRLPIWGVSFVEMIDAHHYAPAAGGKPAIICPLFEDGLCSTWWPRASRRARRAPVRASPLSWGKSGSTTPRRQRPTVRLFGDPIEWLRNGRRGAVVVDWRAARHALADVPGIACETEFLAAQVERAMRQPVCPPEALCTGGQSCSSLKPRRTSGSTSPTALQAPRGQLQSPWLVKSSARLIPSMLYRLRFAGPSRKCRTPYRHRPKWSHHRRWPL